MTPSSSRKRPRSPTGTLPSQRTQPLSKIPSSNLPRTEFHLDAKDLPPFRPGAIRRIAMQNFMTYDDVELYPGPGLNLVLGPNGTGKSSIVSAICVGLGGNPNLLGRASKVREYVKHGKKKAWIEIELVDKNLKALVIKRIFKEESTATIWHVNGKPSKANDVEERIASFNIQLDNLTQFLPQDKVASFASMGPVELLQSTQKAVLKPEIIEKQQQLIEKQQKFLQTSTTVNNYVQQISQLKKQNDVLERDVQRFLERQKHLEKADQLRVRKVFMEFSQLQVEGKKMSESKKEAEKQLAAVVELEAPTENQLKELRKQQQDLDRQEYQQSSEIKRRQQSIKQLNQKLEKVGSMYHQKKDELTRLDSREQDREKMRNQYRRQVEQAQQKLNANADVAPDKQTQDAAIKEKFEAVNAKRREYDEKKGAVHEKQRAIQDSIRGAKYELQKLQQHDERILTTVKNMHRASYDLYQWFVRHKDQFEMPNELYFVPLVVNIRNPLHAKFFESSVAKNYQFGFITPSVRDSNVLTDEIKKRNVQITVLRCGDLSQRDQIRYSKEELRKFGLTDYLDNVIDAPPQVMQVLSDVSSVNLVLFSETPNLKVEDIGHYLPQARTVFEPEVRHYIARSRYSNNSSIRSDSIHQNARLFAGIDRERTQGLQRKLQELTQEHEQLRAELEGMDAEVHALDVKLEEYRNQRREIQRFFAEQQKLRDIIKRYERELQKLSKEENIEALKAQIHAKMREYNEQRMRLIELIKDELSALFKADFSTDIFPILKSKLKDEENQVVQQQSEFHNQRLRAQALVKQLTENFEHLKTRLKTLKVQAIDKRNYYMEKHDKTEEEMRTLLNGLPDDLQVINEQIMIEEAAAASIIDNQNVIREYEKRKLDIAKMEKELEEFTKENCTMEAVIKEIEEEWATPLRKCVEELNQTFQEYTHNFGIAGEVSLNPHESDYAKWEIQIKVKFRDNEPLAILSKSRQSGGERSVTTILYLLALQVINKSPFRVVDEINQGMDPINERKIFRQMLKSCTGKDVPQSFLITPKLLPDLVPHDANNITILFIFNGAFGLDSKDVRDFNNHHKDQNLKL